MKKVLALLLSLVLLLSVASFAVAETYTGKAEGYAGEITAEVIVEDGKITALSLNCESETPAIGGEAAPKLAEAILAAGTIDGVDGIAGATWTSNGIFGAIKDALGITEEAKEVAVEAVSANGLTHGLGLASTPRLGPGADDQEKPVYSFNEVMAYVVADAEGRIVDLEVDILEIITPNHDGADDNFMAGWPGNSWNNDADADGKVDGIYEETPENFSADLLTWTTKRDKGSAYKMNSGTWEEEMDAYENVFKGKTIDEVKEWVATYCSDKNGRSLRGTSTNEEDIAKWNALTPEQQASMDALSCATMSLNDAHGNIIAAIENAMQNQSPITVDSNIASIGLSTVVTPRLGPGSDDKDVPVYSFNVVMAGGCFDEAGKAVALNCDILEIITPNHDGADDNVFTGWPTQSYNSDSNADGAVDEVLTQDEDSFVAQINAFTSKRSLGSKYKMTSGTWAEEMIAFENFFLGKTVAEIADFYKTFGSEVNGRILRGTSDKEQDVEKWNALTTEQQAVVDALTGATMSLNDGHGNLIGAIEKLGTNLKPSVIIVK